MCLGICCHKALSLPGEGDNLLNVGGFGLGGLAMLGLGLFMLSHVPISAVVRPDGIDIRTPLRKMRFAFADFTDIRFMDFAQSAAETGIPLASRLVLSRYRILRLNTPAVEYDLKVSVTNEHAIRGILGAAGVQVR